MKNKLFNSGGDIVAFVFAVVFFCIGIYMLLTDSIMKEEFFGWFILIVMIAGLPLFILKQLTRRPGR